MNDLPSTSILDLTAYGSVFYCCLCSGKCRFTHFPWLRGWAVEYRQFLPLRSPVQIRLKEEVMKTCFHPIICCGCTEIKRESSSKGYRSKIAEPEGSPIRWIVQVEQPFEKAWAISPKFSEDSALTIKSEISKELGGWDCTCFKNPSLIVVAEDMKNLTLLVLWIKALLCLGHAFFQKYLQNMYRGKYQDELNVEIDFWEKWWNGPVECLERATGEGS